MQPSSFLVGSINPRHTDFNSSALSAEVSAIATTFKEFALIFFVFCVNDKSVDEAGTRAANTAVPVENFKKSRLVDAIVCKF